MKKKKIIVVILFLIKSIFSFLNIVFVGATGIEEGGGGSSSSNTANRCLINSSSNENDLIYRMVSLYYSNLAQNEIYEIEPSLMRRIKEYNNTQENTKLWYYRDTKKEIEVW